MLTSRTLSRTTAQASRTPQLRSTLTTKSRTHARTVPHPYAQRRQRHFVRSIAAIAVLGATGTTLQWLHSQNPRHIDAEEPLRSFSNAPTTNTRSQGAGVQIVKSVDTPGVYLWGSNKSGVAAPDAPREKYIHTPRRLPFFDGHVLRDVKLDAAFAAAIDEKGDLLQWGAAYAPNTKEPKYTLKGKNLVSCALSRDRIIALSASGDVYSIPVSADEQRKGPKPNAAKSTGWMGWISSAGASKDDISYRLRTPSSLGLTEKVTQIASGQEHALLLTSSGRVFSLASGTESFPSKGQMGIPGLTWETRPAGAFDQPHELTTLGGSGVKIAKIAAGDYHSVLLDKKGAVYTFGDNSAGQLGFEYEPATAQLDVPTLLPTDELYSAGKTTPGKAKATPGVPATVTDIYAGGSTSFLTVSRPLSSSSSSSSLLSSSSSPSSQDTFAFGFGQTGQLGTGRWRHMQDAPILIPALSSLSEYDEAKNTTVPINVSYISAGATHSAAVLDTREGGDVMVWGANEFYQLGTGRRSNAAAPVYIQPLDRAVEGKGKGPLAEAVEMGKEVAREAAVVIPGVGTGPTGVDQVRDTQFRRFQIAPKSRTRVGAKMLDVQQRIECGRGVTAAYSAAA